MCGETVFEQREDGVAFEVALQEAKRAMQKIFEKEERREPEGNTLRRSLAVTRHGRRARRIA